MKKIIDFFSNLGYKLVFFIIAIPTIFIYMPIRFVLSLLAKLVLLVMNSNKGQEQSEDKNLLQRLAYKTPYKGKNRLLKDLSTKIINRYSFVNFAKAVGMFLIGIPVLFIYVPIRFVLRIIAKLILVIIKLIRKLIGKDQLSTITDNGDLTTGEKIVRFLTYLSVKRHYRGKNKLLLKVDKKILTHSGILYVEVIAFALLLLFFAPFALVILNATKTANEIVADPMAFASNTQTFFKNLSRILTDEQIKYWGSFLNSIIITSGSLITIGVFSGMAAWVLVRTKKIYARLIFVLFLSGMVIPFQVVMLPLVRLLEVFNSSFGLPMKDTYYGVILVYIGFGAPLSVFMLHGFIKSIPMDIEEAAIIDGCSKSQLFFKIILPILKPIFVTLLVLNGLWIWNDYLLPMLVIGMTGDVRTLPLAVANLAGAYVRQWDLLLTSVLLAAIPVVILFLFAQKYIIKGMTSGAIK